MKQIFKKALLCASVVFITMACKEEKPKGTTEVSRPNVIVIMTDDQGYGDLGCHGNPYMKTPNLDQFAAEALELTNFHVGTTCSPTRAGLMTGRNANRNNAWHTIAGCSILLGDEETMAEVFARNGYGTAMFGKWHLGDNYPYRPQDRGFQQTVYHGGGGVGQTPDLWNNNYFDDFYFRNGKPEKFSGYCTDVWFDEALDFLRKKDDSPFFMYLATNAAHGPFNVPEEYAKMYESAPLTDIQKRFYGMVTNIDDNFGRLVGYLKKEGLFDNTILIFTTDNGTARGITYLKEEDKHLGYNSGLRGIKGSHYDGGHKVPFFISWPKGEILQKAKSNELVAHVDLLPTLAALSGISHQPKKPLDGTDMTDVLKGEGERSERMLVVDTQRNQWPEKGRNSCVMSGAWRLVNGSELYNTEQDPGQESDLATEHPDRVEKMRVFYDQWWTSLEPDIRYAEIPVGDPGANPVTITIHDMHTTESLPWNQVQVRKGEFAPDGFYSVKIVEEGTYRFKLYRYPPESGIPVNGTAGEVQGTSFVDGLPQGRSLNPKKAEIEFGGRAFQAIVDADQTFVVLEGTLEQGSYQLKSNFVTADGKRIPSYYTQIEKL